MILVSLLIAFWQPNSSDSGDAVMLTRRCRMAPDQIVAEADSEALFGPDGAGLRGVRVKATSVSNRQLRCIAGWSGETAAETFIVFDDDRVDARYRRLVERAWRAGARAFLRRKGLFGRLPRQRSGEALAVYAVRLERLCGATPGAALRVENGHIRTVGSDADAATGADLDPAESEAWLCAVHAAVATGHDPIHVPVIEVPPLI